MAVLIVVVADHQIMGSSGQGVGARPFEGILGLQEFRVNLGGPAEVEAADVEHAVKGDIAVAGHVDRRNGVNPADPRLERIQLLRGDEIGLVQQDDVGKRYLLHGLVIGVEVGGDVLCVDHRDDGVEAEVAAHLVVGEKGLRHGCRVRQSGRLDQDPVEPVPALEQAAQDADEVPAHGAANATVIHLKKLLIPLDHELVVDTHLAKLVLDHGELAAVLFGQDAVQEGRLSGAEEAGKDGDRYWVVFHADWVRAHRK